MKTLLGERRYLTAVQETLLVFGLSLFFVLVIFWSVLPEIDNNWSGNDVFAYFAWTETWGIFGPAYTTHFGFPEGTNMSAFFTMGYLPHTLASIIAHVSGSVFTGMNIIYLASIPVSAAITYLALRLVVKSGILPIAMSVVFALIPYSVYRMTYGHWDLSMTPGVAAGFFLALAIGLGRVPHWLSKDNPLRVFHATLLFLMIIITAWSSLYYAFFGILITVFSLAWLLLKRYYLKEIAISAIPTVVLVIFLCLAVLPIFVASQQLGVDTSAIERPPYHAIAFSGSFTLMLVPVVIYQFVKDSDYGFSIHTMANGFNSGEGLSIGQYGTIATTICFVVLFFGWFYSMRQRKPNLDILNFVMFQIAAIIMFFIPMGLNYVFTVLVTAQIRSWDRLLPYLFLFGIVGAIVIFENSKYALKSGIAFASWLIILILLVLEQLTFWMSFTGEPMQQSIAYSKAAKEYNYIVNEKIPEHCGVLQLPQGYFSDSASYFGGLPPYDHTLQGVVNENKDYSFGSISGTISDPDLLMPSEVSLLSQESLNSKGFCGIHVDLRGYDETEGESLILSLQGKYGEPIAVGLDGKWGFFDIRLGKGGEQS